LQELSHRLEELPADKTIFTYCKSGRRSETAAELLKANGFNAFSLNGGFSTYTGQFNSAETGTDYSASSSKADEDNINIDPERLKIEAYGLQCPGPLLKVNEVMEDLEIGKQMEIKVTDLGFSTDVEAWAKKKGHAVVKNELADGHITAVLKKNDVLTKSASDGYQMKETKDGATMVVFSGDMDKALASFIIASGARGMGKEVTMFFTFWGLNVIKNPNAAKKNKKGLDKIFSMKMPKSDYKLPIYTYIMIGMGYKMIKKSVYKLPISKMNMFVMGSKMIQHVMNKKKVDALSEMITKADQLGVKMVACTMSMDIMAVDKDELLPNVELGGVGTYLGD